MSLFVINCNCPRSLTIGRGRQESDRRGAKVKIATWNVNGIRARQEQVLEWIGRDRPDVVCLQEIKAKPEQVPEALNHLAGYCCYWHCATAYSGVGLHIRKDFCPDAPQFNHPPFDHD